MTAWTMKNQLRKSIKWPLVVVVVFLVVVAYFNLFDLIEVAFLDPLDNYLHSIGYFFSLKGLFSWIWNIIIPTSSVIGFVININNENFKTKAMEVYEIITVSQLTILLFLLPPLLYLENKFYGRLLNTND